MAARLHAGSPAAVQAAQRLSSSRRVTVSRWIEGLPPFLQAVVLLVLLIVPTIVVPLAVELWGLP